MKKRFAAALLAFASTFATPAFAGAVVGGFNAFTFPGNDDGAIGPIALGFTANFFGVNRTTTFISNNGYVTFNSAQGTFTPTGLGAGYSGQPIIAPFFADVDTRSGNPTTYGYGTFNGRNTLGVNWIDVGYYSVHTNKLNSFQTLLVDRADTGAGNFDIFFNYDKIQWETGDASGGSNGLGGTSAAAGYNAGTGAPGSFFQLNGSLVNGAFLDGGPNSLVAGSNVNVAGRYLFQVRNGNVIPGGVPEPTTWALLILGFGAIGTAMRKAKVRTALSYA